MHIDQHYTLTREQTTVALQKLLAEKAHESQLDRFIRATAQQLGRVAFFSFMTAFLFIDRYGRVAVGFMVMAALLAIAQIANDRMRLFERMVEGQAAAQRLGIRQRFETEVRSLQNRTWYWIFLIPMYAYLFVAQWLNWPRPWWLFALGWGLLAKLGYDAIRGRMEENRYYESVVELEQLLTVRQEAGEMTLSTHEAEQLYTIEQRQTKRQVAQALLQKDDIPLSALEDELKSTIREAYSARTPPTQSS